MIEVYCLDKSHEKEEPNTPKMIFDNVDEVEIGFSQANYSCQCGNQVIVSFQTMYK